AALIAGFIWRPRMLIRRTKWELILLLIVLLLAMIPTAGVFRWSFRWLPLFHLVLAICAAEVLNVRPNSPTVSTIVLALIVVTIPMSIFGLAGNYGPTVTWIYFQIAVVWALYELFLPRMRFRDWAPPVATFAILLTTYFCIPSNCGVPKYNLSQELLNSAPLDPHRLYLSVYPPAESTYRIENKPASVGQLVRPGSTSMWAGLHFLNGYSPILPAGIAREFDFRIHVTTDVDVPSGGAPALLTFSRPFFRGYQARLGNQKLHVDSYRGLFPMVEVPAGSHGQVVLTYRPSWLIFGGTLSIFSAAIWLLGLLAAARVFKPRP